MSKEYKINNVVLTFNEIYYVNSTNGLDTNNGLTPETAFKTINKYSQQKVENSACILSDGTHNVGAGDKASFTKSGFDSGFDYTRTYIGSGLDTKIKLSSDETMVSFSGKQKYTKFIRLCIQATSGSNNSLITTLGNEPAYLEFDNVLFFNNPTGAQYIGLYWSSGETISKMVDKCVSFTNCSVQGKLYNSDDSYVVARLGYFKPKLINCVSLSNYSYLSYTSLTNINSNIDKNGNITEIIEWEHIGTGENPDNTQANIGVYGGKYAWGKWGEVYCALLNNNNYVRIHQDGNISIIASIIDDKDIIKSAIMEHGNTLDELNALPQEIKNLFIGQAIVVVSNLEDITEAKISYRALPKINKRLAIPTGYADLSLAYSVKKIKSAYTLANNGMVYVVLSNGDKYYGNNLTEITLDNPLPETPYDRDSSSQEWDDWSASDKTSDVQKIINKGIPINQLEHITAEQWEIIFPKETNDKKIKFLYAFDIQSAEDIAKIASLELTKESVGYYAALSKDNFKQKLYKDRLEIYYIGAATQNELNMIIELGGSGE